jgi:hypothetical protein
MIQNCGRPTNLIPVMHLLRRLLAFLLSVTLSPIVSAVSVSTTGLGQVLLFPYYTVRPTASGGSYNTLFIVTNTTPDTKVVRVRFRESRNGREVASLNVYLGPYDSWTGAIVPDAGGAVLTTNDTSCVDPIAFSRDHRLAFSNAQYSGANSDGEDTSLARTMEGYFEVFDLGVVKDQAVLTNIKNCVTAFAVPLNNGTNMAPPSGGLVGNANIISVTDGTLYPFDATALAGFSAVPLYNVPTAPSPTLADVNPKVSRVFDDAGAHEATWDVSKGASPADPVSAVLMADQLINWFIQDPQTESTTDWVVTMPTKPFYVAVDARGAAPLSGSARPPFQSNFSTGGAPEYFGFYGGCNSDKSGTVQADREGRTNTSDACGVPPQSTDITLNWTASVLTFNQSAPTVTLLLNAYRPMVYGASWVNGWARLRPWLPFAAGLHIHQLVSTDTPPTTYYGLPMIGFMANDYVNRTLQVGTQTVLSNYGATAPHKVVRRMQ